MLIPAAQIAGWEASLSFPEIPGISSPFPLPAPNSLLAQRNVLGAVSAPGGAALKQKLWGRRSAAKSPLLLQDELGDAGIQGMPPTTNTGSFPGCLYTFGKQTNKEGIQTSPQRLTEHFNANTNNSQGLPEDRKSTSFVCDPNIKLQLTPHLCTSIAEVFPAQEAEELTPSRCFHRTLSIVGRGSPWRS